MSFDSLAPAYRAMERVLAGSLLQQCRTAYLEEVRQARNALLLGEGPGRYLLELLRVNPHVRVTYLDSSAGMVAVARAQMAARGFSETRAFFVCTDWRDWDGAGGPFDLVATHFFLDCFNANELAVLVAKVKAWAGESALWVVSDFCEPAGGWRRFRARLVLRLAYLFFRWTTGLSASSLVCPDPLLANTGLALIERRFFNYGLLHADLWRAVPPGAASGFPGMQRRGCAL